MKAVNKRKVAIELMPLEEEGVIKMDQITRDEFFKKQNRGKVLIVGEGCEFCQPGDIVSFTRAAATKLTHEDIEYHVVDEAHVLAKF